MESCSSDPREAIVRETSSTGELLVAANEWLLSNLSQFSGGSAETSVQPIVIVVIARPLVRNCSLSLAVALQIRRNKKKNRQLIVSRNFCDRSASRKNRN